MSFEHCQASPWPAFKSSSRTHRVVLGDYFPDIQKLNTSIYKFGSLPLKFRYETTLKTCKATLEHSSTSKVQLQNVLVVLGCSNSKPLQIKYTRSKTCLNMLITFLEHVSLQTSLFILRVLTISPTLEHSSSNDTWNFLKHFHGLNEPYSISQHSTCYHIRVNAPNLLGTPTSYYYATKATQSNMDFTLAFSFHAYMLLHTHCHLKELPSQTLVMLII